MNYDRFGLWDTNRLNQVRSIVEALSTVQTKVEKILEDILDDDDWRLDAVFDYAWKAMRIVNIELDNASLKEGEEDKRQEITDDLIEFKDKTPMENVSRYLWEIIWLTNRRVFNAFNG